MTRSRLYVLLQFVATTVLIIFTPWFRLDLLFILQLLALIFAIAAIKASGPPNWSVYPEPNETSEIVTSGPYRIVRHPMYSSLLLFFLPSVFRQFELVAVISYLVLFATLVYKISYEERLIIVKHPEYIIYKEATPYKIFPVIW